MRLTIANQIAVCTHVYCDHFESLPSRALNRRSNAKPNDQKRLSIGNKLLSGIHSSFKYPILPSRYYPQRHDARHMHSWNERILLESV